MTMYRSAALLLLLLAAVANAFVVVPPAKTSTQLNLKFLKDLGLEKPSWLPDFGGDKEEEKAAADDDEAAEGDVATEEAKAE